MLSKRMFLTSTISSYFSVKVFCSSSRGILAQAGEQLLVHAGDAGRRLLQAFAVGIFADGEQDLADGRRDAFEIDGLVPQLHAHSAALEEDCRLRSSYVLELDQSVWRVVGRRCRVRETHRVGQ